MLINSEVDITNQDIRAALIKQIEQPENQHRKDQAFKRYECYKDATSKYVMQELLRQFDADTVYEMRYALTNLALVRKCIDKLARVYKYGVERKVHKEDPIKLDTEIQDGVPTETPPGATPTTDPNPAPDAADGSAPPDAPAAPAPMTPLLPKPVVPEDADTVKLQELAKELNFDSQISKCNRFYKLFMNTMFFICPKADEEGDDPTKQTIVCQPLAPYIYDVASFADRPDLPCAVILSDYTCKPKQPGFSRVDDRIVPQLISIANPDGTVDFKSSQAPQIAQPSVDENKKQYIFWTKSFHFTCNAKGEIISQGDGANPIKRLPFVNFSKDQDGSFFASGGGDLVDGSILINSMLTNINHIAITQGYGQLVMTGKGLPRNVKLGPNKAVLLELSDKETDPQPTFEFKNANPPLDQLRALVEMQVALLLTTNNLSTSGVASQLNSASSANMASGIAMLIDKSESIEDIDDQRQLFVDNEPLIWSIIADWQTVLKQTNQLCDTLVPLMIENDMEISLKFGEPQVIETETDRLNALVLKQTLGIISKIEMIKEENPGFTDEQAQEELDRINQEKMNNMSAFGLGAVTNEGDGNNSQQKSDNGNAGPGNGGPGFGKAGSGPVPTGAGSKVGGFGNKPGNR